MTIEQFLMKESVPHGKRIDIETDEATLSVTHMNLMVGIKGEIPDTYKAVRIYGMADDPCEISADWKKIIIDAINNCNPAIASKFNPITA